MSWSPSVSRQLPAKQSLGQRFKGHKVRKRVVWDRKGRKGSWGRAGLN